MKKFFKVLIPCAVALALPLMFSADAKAFLGLGGGEDPQASPAPTAPVFAIHDEQTFMNGTKEFHLIPYGDISLEFAILLPKDWYSEPNPNTDPPDLSKKIVAHIAKFSNPPTEAVRTHVYVEALHLDYEIDAKNWLKYYILSNGFAPEGEIIEKDLKRASATYVRVADTVSTHTYISVQFSGNLAMITRFEMPLHYKDYMGFLQKKSVDSFKLIYEKEGTVEEQGVFTLVDSLKFNYPMSWNTASNDFKDLNKLSVQLHNRNIAGVLDGYIRFYAVRRSDGGNFVSETEGIRKYFTDVMKLDFKKMISSEKFDYLKRFGFGRKEVYLVGSTEPNRQDQELVLFALADYDWYIYAILITPIPEHKLATWARNRRSFDLIIKSFK